MMTWIRFDASTLREDHLEELLAWIKSLDIDPASVRSKGLILTGDQSYELHLSRFIRSEAGRIQIDQAAEWPITEPLIIDLGTSATWPSWLGADA